MSSSSESSASEDEYEFDETCMDGSNAFAFEPEYPEEDVQQRLLHHFSQAESDTVDFIIHGDEESASEDDGNGCTCENCVQMQNDFEQVCCQDNSAMIGNKLGTEKCIARTSAFRDVCLNVNVLEAALGTWRTFTDNALNISNKSYRFIAYRQYISWVYGWLGKDVRRIIPACVVNTIRDTFPAQDGIYVPFADVQ